MITLINSQLNIVNSKSTSCWMQHIIIDENTGDLLNIKNNFYDAWIAQQNTIEHISREDFDPHEIWREFIIMANKAYEYDFEESITEWEQSSDDEYIRFEFFVDEDMGFAAVIELHRYLFEKHMFKFVQDFKFDTVIYKSEGNVRGAYITIADKEYFFERR